MGTRDNNGVKSTVKNDVGRGSVNRTGGDSAVEKDNGGIGGSRTAPNHNQDMATHNGPIQRPVERDNGGINSTTGSETREKAR